MPAIMFGLDTYARTMEAAGVLTYLKGHGGLSIDAMPLGGHVMAILDARRELSGLLPERLVR